MSRLHIFLSMLQGNTATIGQTGTASGTGATVKNTAIVQQVGGMCVRMRTHACAGVGKEDGVTPPLCSR